VAYEPIRLFATTSQEKKRRWVGRRSAEKQVEKSIDCRTYPAAVILSTIVGTGSEIPLGPNQVRSGLLYPSGALLQGVYE
jgi:hypothetical protein